MLQMIWASSLNSLMTSLRSGRNILQSITRTFRRLLCSVCNWYMFSNGLWVCLAKETSALFEKAHKNPTQEAQISQFYTGNWTQPISVDLCEAGNIKFASKPHVGMTWSAIGAHALKFWETCYAQFQTFVRTGGLLTETMFGFVSWTK